VHVKHGEPERKPAFRLTTTHLMFYRSPFMGEAGIPAQSETDQRSHECRSHSRPLRLLRLPGKAWPTSRANPWWYTFPTVPRSGATKVIGPRRPALWDAVTDTVTKRMRRTASLIGTGSHCGGGTARAWRRDRHRRQVRVTTRIRRALVRSVATQWNNNASRYRHACHRIHTRRTGFIRQPSRTRRRIRCCSTKTVTRLFLTRAPSPYARMRSQPPYRTCRPGLPGVRPLGVRYPLQFYRLFIASPRPPNNSSHGALRGSGTALEMGRWVTITDQATSRAVDTPRLEKLRRALVSAA